VTGILAAVLLLDIVVFGVGTPLYGSSRKVQETESGLVSLIPVPVRVIKVTENKPHFISQEGVDTDCNKRQDLYYKHQAIVSIFALITGFALFFYGAWNLKLGPQDWRGFLAATLGLYLFGHGVDLRLNLVKWRYETANFCQDFLDDAKNERLGVHVLNRHRNLQKTDVLKYLTDRTFLRYYTDHERE
jgi:hypothetical protein